MRHIQAGFTLVEMIMVIIVSAILAVGVTQFMGQAVQGYADAGDRQQLATIGWIVSERLSRELRTALPNSIRVNATHSCIEFIPTLAGSDYLSAPVATSGSSLNIVRLRNFTLGSNDRVAIYPVSSATLYPPVSPGVLSTSTINQLSIISGDEYKLGLVGTYQFLTNAPEKRFYITSNPVTYCITGNSIIRYRNYGFVSTIASALTNPEVIVNQITSGYFDYSPATLVRNGVVTMNFTIRNAITKEQQVINQEVQIRNVP